MYNLSYGNEFALPDNKTRFETEVKQLGNGLLKMSEIKRSFTLSLSILKVFAHKKRKNYTKMNNLINRTFTAKHTIRPCLRPLRYFTSRPLSAGDSYVSYHLLDITAPVTSFNTTTFSPLINISDVSHLCMKNVKKQKKRYFI